MRILCTLSFLGAAGSLITPSTDRQAPYNKPDSGHVEDTYFVAFHDNHTLEDHFLFIGQNLSETATYFHSLHGFGYHAQLDSFIVHELIRYDPGVLQVDHDIYVENITPIENREVDDREVEDYTSHPDFPSRRWLEMDLQNPPYGPAMVTAGGKVDFGNGKTSAYDYYESAGEGVNIYIVDTGVNIQHEQFGGRASNFKGATTSKYCTRKNVQETMDDMDGHGTHVAGIAAGTLFGMAPKANIINVKAICDTPYKTTQTSFAWIVTALFDVIQEHRGNIGKTGFKGSVINLSFGGPPFDMFAKVLTKAYEAGIVVVGAAGNGNAKITEAPCIYRGTVICVVFCDSNYNKGDRSNYGRLANIIAPGQDIIGPSNGTVNAYRVVTGTSQATPFVAGVAAVFIAYESLTTVQDVWNHVYKNALPGLVTGFNSKTPNYLVNSGINNPGKPVGDPYNGVGNNLANDVGAAPSTTTVGDMSYVDIASVHTNDFEGELTLGPLETTGADYSSVMASLSALDLGAYTGSVPVATYSGEVGMATES